MSGHERDHRVHRHGLAPLPADASGEQREVRIAELRQLRRTRRRTLALRGGIATLAMAAGLALLLYWLLMTIGGRDLLLRELVARLPAGTELTVVPLGPGTLTGVTSSAKRPASQAAMARS